VAVSAGQQVQPQGNVYDKIKLKQVVILFAANLSEYTETYDWMKVNN